MLVTILTALYMVVRAAESLLAVRWVRQPDPLPYIVSQPLPWQVHSVSHSRRASQNNESDVKRRSSMGAYRNKFLSNSSLAATLAIPCLLTCPDADESDGLPETPTSPVQANRAAATIQSQYRKYQQRKYRDAK